MADAWSSRSVSEPEWTDEARNEALAHVHISNLTCRECGQRGALVEVEKVDYDRVDWAAHGYPRRFAVKQYRCLACASVETVREAIAKSLPKDDHDAARRKFAGLRIVPSEIPRT